jgi:hypothetical protein
MTQENNEQNVVNFRLDRLEEAVAKLSTLSEVIIRWDAKFAAQGTFLNCSVHTSRMIEFEKRLEEIYKITVDRTKGYLEIEQHDIKLKAVEEEISAMRAFMNRAIGAMVILSIIVQLFGPVAVDYVRGTNTPPVTVIDAGGGYHLDLSRVGTNINAR